jgi:hypothetical protein
MTSILRVASAGHSERKTAVEGVIVSTELLLDVGVVLTRGASSVAVCN